MIGTDQPLRPDLVAKIDSLVAQYGAGTPVSAVDVVAQLAPLGLVPPSAFVEFISRWGGCFVGIAVHGWENASILGKETCIDLTLHARAGLGEMMDGVLVFSDDGCGNPIGIDREGGVYLFDHSGEPQKLAESFLHLLEQLV
jgi:hypothetical protein